MRYSGKKKAHSDKNVVIATVKKKRVSFLSQAYPGKTHDKKVVEKELTEKEKANNRKISRVPIRVEHAIAGVTRSRSVKDLRNTKVG